MKNKSNKWQSEIPNEDGIYWLDVSEMFLGTQFESDRFGPFILDVFGNGAGKLVHGSGGNFYAEDVINSGLMGYRVAKIEFENKWMSWDECKKSKEQARIYQIKSKMGYVGAVIIKKGSDYLNIIWDNDPHTRQLSGIIPKEEYKFYPLKPPPIGWSVYMIKSSKDNSIYTGISNNVQARLQAHNKNKGAKYTKTRTPFALIYEEYCGTKSSASKREHTIKKLTRKQKDKLAMDSNGSPPSKD